MSSKLNFACKRVFVEFAADKHCHKDKPSFNFAKYPLLSKSFLYSSKCPRPVFCLIVTPQDSGLEVSFIKTAECYEPRLYSGMMNVSPDSIQRMLALFNLPVVRVNVHSSHSSDQIQDLFDDYRGKLCLNTRFYDENWMDLRYLTHDEENELSQLVNKLNSKIGSMMDAEKLLLNERVLPLGLDYCSAEDLNNEDQLRRLIDRHEIKRLVAGTTFFNPGEEGGPPPPRNIGGLKDLEIWVDFVDLDEFAGFLTRNNFNLARLLVFTWIEFNYSNLDSILNCIMESHQKRVNFKERCNNVAEKLQIKTKYLLHPNPNPDPDNDGVEFKPEWVGEIRRQCHFLKDAKYEAGDGYHFLETHVVDGHFTFDVRLIIHL